LSQLYGLIRRRKTKGIDFLEKKKEKEQNQTYLDFLQNFSSNPKDSLISLAEMKFLLIQIFIAIKILCQYPWERNAFKNPFDL